MKINLSLCLLVLIAAGCRPDEEPKNNTTIDYIRRTGRLWGVAEVTLNDNGSITLLDTKSTGVGLNLMMRDAENNVVDSVTLSPGQSCSLSDGRHVFITYELKAIEQGRITFTITDKFDARSFGDGIKETKTTITITPYTKQDLPQQTN
jgi:ribosomal protein S4E